MSKLSLEDLRKLRANVQAETAKRNAKTARVVVSMGTCGIAAGAKDTYDAFKKELAAKGLTDIIVSQTGCMGFCQHEPTIEVAVPGMESIIYGDVKGDAVAKIVTEHLVGKKIVEELKIEKPSIDIIAEPNSKEQKKQYRIVLRNCGVIDPEKIEEYIAREGYMALEKTLFAMKPEEVVEEMKKSGQRGRGGAGFPTGVKWESAAAQPKGQKYIVCNADEGDPGAYMDRATLEGDPHSVLEAMAIGGYAVGADKGFIYIRAEYPLAIQRLQVAIDQAREMGLLGKDILGSGFNFDIELRYGAGAFVCGEGTALQHSIEGKRGMPRPKPPNSVVAGLWARPTVINNVETLAAIPMIITRGADWFNHIGTTDTPGTKVFALTGKVNVSGLVEVPMGTTLRQIVFDIGGGIRGGHKFKAAQTGGPSGGMIPEQYLDQPIDFGSLAKIGSIMGSGGLIVMDETDCVVDIAKFYLDFSVEESCGKCAPCRIGSRKLLDYLTKISEGRATVEDIHQMERISQAMCKASLCGLGQSAANPVLSILKFFKDEVLEHVTDKKCRASKCQKLLKYTIHADKCKGCTMCARNCPAKAITGALKKPHVIDQAKCVKCGACMTNCKFGAITRG